MTRKQKVAKFIEEHPSAKFEDWVLFQKTVPEVRLKKSGKSAVLINLEGRSGFSDPKSWLANHRAGCMQRLERAVEDCNGVLTKDEVTEILSALKASESGKDLEEKASLMEQIKALRESLDYDRMVVEHVIKQFHASEMKPPRFALVMLYCLLYRISAKKSQSDDELWSLIQQKVDFGQR